MLTFKQFLNDKLNKLYAKNFNLLMNDYGVEYKESKDDKHSYVRME